MPSILKSKSLTSKPDERNAAQYSGVTLYVAWNSIESDICCPSRDSLISIYTLLLSPCLCLHDPVASLCSVLGEKKAGGGSRDLYV